MDDILVEKTVIHSVEFGNRFIREWEVSKSDLVPPEFICPMTLDIMVDPVVIASGQTYERSYIERWFREGHKTCPKTNQVLPHTNICPNYAVRAVIENWCKKNGIILSKKVCPKEKTRVSVPGSLEDYQVNKSGDLKNRKFPFYLNHEAFPLPHSADVLRSREDMIAAQGALSNLSIDAGVARSQIHPKPSTPKHRRQLSLPASPVATSDPQSSALPDKCITRSCKAQRLHQFKQMMVQFSSPNSENSAERPPLAGYPDHGREGHHPAPQGSKTTKNSINIPHNLSLTKIPIQPPQVHSLVGLPNQRKGSYTTGRKLSTIYSPNAENLSRHATDFSDPTPSTPVHDWSADVDIKGILVKITHGTPAEIRMASEEMRGLSKASQATRLRICELGGIPKLIALLKSSDFVVVEHAVTALLNLALETNLKIEIVKCGALRPLADILSHKKHSDKARENAAGALCSLSVAEENRDTICSEGIIPLLVESLKSKTSLRGMKDASIGLFNLAISPSGRKLVVSTGIVSHLVKMLAEGNLQVEEEVMALLSNLSKAEEACMMLENEGAISLLVGVLEDGSPRSKISAVSVLLQMAASDSARESMWEEGAIPCLQGLSQGVINGRGREKVVALLKILRETR